MKIGPTHWRVGTFFVDVSGRRPVKSRVSVYTYWYSTEWAGCIEYDVVGAGSASEAKEVAVGLRLEYELAQWRSK